MILLDADVLLIDIRFPRDANFAVNQQLLERLRSERRAAGIAAQALLEVVGILSFNVSPAKIPALARQVARQYRLTIVPDWKSHPEYAGCRVQEILDQMTRQMALGDAVQAVQIERFAPQAECLLTWNARHFVGKLVIPVFTPQEWLAQQTLPAS